MAMNKTVVYVAVTLCGPSQNLDELALTTHSGHMSNEVLGDRYED